ncbi:glycosyltransferase involved in cell wall biosynthesis [Chitinophaga dinghuensis]|uniref:Glycosyltransferase involved in cell wall biosynthesis n=2 Tax=Chitinophaga dinghuensis TaxID=1539050 RepID=A0A327VMP2_9BACT|nr:glycosyltransferase involved in cell wall biosynthesis [Chitinophaga dinghuensis]
MPCFNGEKYIGRSIESILSQTFDSLELIIINDGSTDESERTISSYLKDPRVKYHALEKNMGNYYARNYGMKLATAKYIAVMDADDIADSNRLQIAFDFLECHKRVGAVGSQGFWIDTEDKIIGNLNKPYHTRRLNMLLLKNNFTLHPSLMFRNTLLKRNNLYYNERLRYSADYDFVVRCSQYFRIENIPNRIIKYRMHSEQISSKRKQEQTAFANEVRFMQLKRFGINMSDEEINLYQQLMREDHLTVAEINVLLEFLNRIVESNKKLRLYPTSHLFNFFQLLLSKAYHKAITVIDKLSYSDR